MKTILKTLALLGLLAYAVPALAIPDSDHKTSNAQHDIDRERGKVAADTAALAGASSHEAHALQHDIARDNARIDHDLAGCAACH